MTSRVGQQVRAAVAARLGATRAASPPDYLVGLVGRGIGLSRSPAMHEREGARMGLGYAYVLLDFDQMGLADTDLDAVIRSSRR